MKFLEAAKLEENGSEAYWEKFEGQFLEHIRTLKSLIRNVTLGANYTPKPEQLTGSL